MQNNDKDECFSPSKSSSGGESHRKPRHTLTNFLEDSDIESWGESEEEFDGDYCAAEGNADDLVASDLFDEPCEPVVTSGGTAAFFHVRYKIGKAPPDHTRNQYIGKDLIHARDEIDFYADLRKVAAEDTRYSNFAQLCMDCPGFCNLSCKSLGESSINNRILLLLENLCNGYEKMRLVDVKMGAETSVACWKGKTRLNAWRNARVDQRTNSHIEGFRLEGMEFPPQSVQDRIDVVEIGSSNMMRSKIIGSRVAKRFLLQRLRAHEFLAAWCDVSGLGAGAELHAHSALWSALEQVYILIRLCIDLPVPQQWIGSSIAVGLEVGSISSNPKVIVRVFDWGRAELSSIEHHRSLPMEQRKIRLRYWRQYLRAVCRFYWEICRIVAHRCCCPSWKAFVFELRIEPVSIVRAAVMGKTVSEVRSMGLFILPAKGVKGGCATVQAPLVAPRNAAVAPNDKPSAGIVHFVISAPEDGMSGEGSVVIDLKGVTEVPHDVDHSATAFIVMRVIGFENLGDAKLHVDKYRGGHSEPTPRGRAYALTTGPGKFVSSVLVWEHRFEFIGVGNGSRKAHEKLQNFIPATYTNGENVTAPIGNGKEALPWPELLPPTVGDESVFESVSQLFSQRMVSWLDESSPLPKDWP